MIKNTFAFAGPDWESLYIQRVRRNAHLSKKWQQRLVPINYAIPVSSLELGDLADQEVTLVAPNTSETFRSSLAECLLKANASLVCAVSDVGSISVYRGKR